MKDEPTVDCDARLEALLAEQPVEVAPDFTHRVFLALADEAADVALREQPAEVSAGFVDRVMAEISKAEKTEKGNAVAFPRGGKTLRFARRILAGTGAVALAVGVGLFSFFHHSPSAETEDSATLCARVEQVLAANADLAEIVAATTADEEAFSFDEWIAASQILTGLDETSTETAELFAYYEN